MGRGWELATVRQAQSGLFIVRRDIQGFSVAPGVHEAERGSEQVAADSAEYLSHRGGQAAGGAPPPPGHSAGELPRAQLAVAGQKTSHSRAVIF